MEANIVRGVETVKVLGERRIPISAIVIGHFQIRRWSGRVGELAANIRTVGQIQHIGVRPFADDRYELLWGQQRVNALLSAGQSTVNAVVMECDDREGLLLSISENLVRNELSPIEKEEALARLRKYYASDAEMARALGPSRAWIGRLLHARSFRQANPFSETVPSSLIAESERLGDDRSRVLLLQDVESGRISQKRARAICRKADERSRWLADSERRADPDDESKSSTQSSHDMQAEPRGRRTPRELLDALIDSFSRETDVDERKAVALDGFSFFSHYVNGETASPASMKATEEKVAGDGR